MNRWSIRDLGYAIIDYLPGLTAERQDALKQQAWDAWSAKADIRAHRTTPELANVKYVASALPPDFTGKRMYAATIKPAGDGFANSGEAALLSTFDPAWPWGELLFLGVSGHEIGHSLGLDDSPDTAALMNGTFRGFTAPQPSDIDAIQALYGPPKPMSTFNGIDTWQTLAGPIDAFHCRFKTTTGGVIVSQAAPGAKPGAGAPAGYVPMLHVGLDGLLRSSLYWYGDINARLVSAKPVNDGQWHDVRLISEGGREGLSVDASMTLAMLSRQRVEYAGGRYSYFLGTGYTAQWAGGNGGWHFFQGEIEVLTDAPLTLPPLDDVLRVFQGKTFAPTGWRLVS